MPRLNYASANALWDTLMMASTHCKLPKFAVLYGGMCGCFSTNFRDENMFYETHELPEEPGKVWLFLPVSPALGRAHRASSSTLEWRRWCASGVAGVLRFQARQVCGVDAAGTKIHLPRENAFPEVWPPPGPAVHTTGVLGTA